MYGMWKDRHIMLRDGIPSIRLFKGDGLKDELRAGGDEDDEPMTCADNQWHTIRLVVADISSSSAPQPEQKSKTAETVT